MDTSSLSRVAIEIVNNVTLATHDSNVNRDSVHYQIIKPKIEININANDLKIQSNSLKNDLLRIQSNYNDEKDIVDLNSASGQLQQENDSPLSKIKTEDLNFHRVFDEFFKEYKTDIEQQLLNTPVDQAEDDEIIILEPDEENASNIVQPSAKRLKLDVSTVTLKNEPQQLDDSICFLHKKEKN